MTEPSPSSIRRPGPRRVRVSHACVACQQKKQKCDGQTPACRNCLRANRTCVSKDPSTERRHPRGYIESLEQHNNALEDHIAQLERTLRRQHPQEDLDALLQNATPQSGDGSPDQPARDDGYMHAMSSDWQGEPAHQLNNSLPSLRTGNAQVHDNGAGTTDDEPGLEFLCLRSAGAEPHYFGASSAYSFTKMFSASLRAVRKQAPGLSMSGVTDESAEQPRNATPAPLPDRKMVKLLSGAYFEQVHPQFPFLHEPTYRQWEEDVLTALEAGNEPRPSDLFFVYALCAVGALTGPLAGATLPQGLYSAAEALFEQVMQQNSIESIQAVLCCAMYSIRSPVGVSVWMLSGLALRQCVELGLHRKSRWSRLSSNPLKLEIRKRVFWCSYNLDRAVALTLGRPVGIADLDIDVQFPLDIDDQHITEVELTGKPRETASDPVTMMSAAIHTIRNRQIWARIQSYIYPQVGVDGNAHSPSIFEGFKRELLEWLEAAPSQLPSNQWNNNAFGSKEWFNLMYHQSIIILNHKRLASPGAEGNSPQVYLDCANSAQSICKIYRHLYVTQRLNDTWGALHVLFLGAVTFLHCLWSSDSVRQTYRQDQVSSTCTSIIIVLAIMAERWSAVGVYRDAFEMLASATQTMLFEVSARQVAPSLPVIPPGGQFQFTDYLADMSEIGMCTSVEDLLSGMV